MARDKDGAIVTTTTNSKNLPKGLLQVLSDIEQYSVAEKEGSSIPEEVLTTEKMRTYWIEGGRVSAFSSVATFILSLFMFAAHDGIIPVFGSYSPSTFERVFILLFTVSSSLVTSLLVFAILRKTYCKNITRKAIYAVTFGMASVIVLSTIVMFIVVHILYFNFLTPDHILRMIWKLPEFLRPGYKTYLWMTKFIEQLIPSVYFLTIVSLFSILILALSVVMGKIKTNRIDKYKKIWQ
ncbi:MAG: hypothetical protein A2X99_10965 [Deltaproteobacteria bacterium GWB2_55_19]|nr:MAG: hypothetical protein A2X99_10965 [Deltaproteobacteria bacterium GWB2_55_19]